MIGTTRSRVSFFMNKFRKLGFIDYNGHLKIHNSLLNVILHDNPSLKRSRKVIVVFRPRPEVPRNRLEGPIQFRKAHRRDWAAIALPDHGVFGPAFARGLWRPLATPQVD
jgi:hypothetical protein